ncbi:HNH endonuclease [Azotobacter beijerinckii]|uniref:HNH endonuclease n=1 Tax=Azotobacter beijerinckii TaxID=170623 RepID=A0A1H6XRY0_9GAMM|nr:HNH endonuclease [Azotobacter beijerinckii]SEJ31803.1 HNH endonuclease [Azotobacter beijerinckii]
MARLKALKPRIQTISQTIAKPAAVSERRMTGRKLQSRRFNVWLRDPCCATCRRVVEYPGGFELDHKVPLFKGGEDSEENCQILCSGPDGCHAKKTAEDLRGW